MLAQNNNNTAKDVNLPKTTCTFSVLKKIQYIVENRLALQTEFWNLSNLAKN